VLTEHVADQALGAGGESALSDQEIHDRDLAWLAQADAVVAEVTVPSLGVGYEVARALQRGIPVLCLYRPVPGRRLSAMIAGASGVEVVAYEHLSEAKVAISRFLRQ
jgi:2'-deoxynucleoside 5'-phosphate N-hydrolase